MKAAVTFDAWMILALAGWVISAGVHLTSWQTPLHHYVYTAQLLAVLPVFIVAVWRHPRRRATEDGAEVKLWNVFSGAPLWVHILGWGSIAYAATVNAYIGAPSELPLGAAMTHVERVAASGIFVACFAAAFGMLWSYRAHASAP